MKSNEREKVIKQRVDEAIAKLRTIRKLCSKGGFVGDYHHDQLTEILESLRHHTRQQSAENKITGICGF